ncbi:leucine-rich repeat [Perkinsela sp. CCAP 1560/4]|nr:leucine-rich repeat [Perkinsela sp. CCAP 1560/4]|eukprot:KNH05704.1 leucine-rich repeat [Perkinsela sp. CCAP 1560/4]
MITRKAESMRIRVERHVQFSNCAIKTKTKHQLSGSVVLTQLPSCLEYLDLASNQFTGALDLTRLPSSMCILYLYSNSFSGTVDLSQLPQKLECLTLSGNGLSGEVFISDALFEDIEVGGTKIIKRHME